MELVHLKRELIYVGDIADACLPFFNKTKLNETLINIGTGTDYTIKYTMQIF
jgi:GDP-L-fucose synthase